MTKYGYDFYIIAGFLSGSILFGRLFPMLLCRVDVQKESEDGNPGTFNAFVCGGVLCGILVLLADIGKGLIPVSLCARNLGMESWKFALVMAAPVFGHAHSVLQKGHGGKAIAVSFGVLLGLYPVSRPLFLLICSYLLFVIIIPVKSNTRKSIYAFLTFGILSILTVPQKVIHLCCLLMAAIVIHKHCLKTGAVFRRGKEWRTE